MRSRGMLTTDRGRGRPWALPVHDWALGQEKEVSARSTPVHNARPPNYYSTVPYSAVLLSFPALAAAAQRRQLQNRALAAVPLAV